ncbi:MAG: hypothetical protein GWN64_07965 [Candidatus Thorarchaeota archaeon]|nr:hypothetical protein [Candidatus Thorarchaeota archaeon]
MFNLLRKKRKIKEQPSPIQQMGEASYPVLSLPFNGTTVCCKVRCLNRTQLRAVGEFHLIDLSKVEDKEEISLQDMIELVNWQEALMKETLISPTFDEIQEKVYGQDNRIVELKERLASIKERMKDIPANERKELDSEANSIELYIGSLLPNDFMNAVTSWATGVERSDIKKINREMLLEAAVLAHNGHDNPADHMQGNFLDIHREEINSAAWMVYNQYQKDKQTESENNKAIFGSKNTKIVRGGEVNK